MTQYEFNNRVYKAIRILDYNGIKRSGRKVQEISGFNRRAFLKGMEKSDILIENVATSNPRKCPPTGAGPLFPNHTPLCHYLGNKWSTIYLTPNPTDMEYLLGSIGLPVLSTNFSLKLKTLPILDVLGAIMYGVLKQSGFLHHSTGFQNGYLFSKHLVNLSRTVSLTSGKIHHKNPNLYYLLRHDKRFNFSKLIERHGSYSVNRHSYSYRFTDYYSDTLLPRVMDILSTLPFSVIKPHKTDIIVPFKVSTSIPARDLFTLLSSLKGVSTSGYIVSYNETDRQYSRKYNLFTSIGSATRKQLGYYNYDIDAALQSIVSNFINMDSYPLHKALIADKHTVRGQISLETGKSIPEVKTILSAADNGKKYKELQTKSPMLVKYVEESSRLADEFNTELLSINESMGLRAYDLAKPIFVRVWSKRKKGDFKWVATDQKNKYSHFFFGWTQIEREIRDAMISCFTDKDDTREVHDAVYSKELIDYSVIETAISNQTGLENIRISG